MCSLRRAARSQRAPARGSVPRLRLENTWALRSPLRRRAGAPRPLVAPRSRRGADWPVAGDFGPRGGAIRVRGRSTPRPRRRRSPTSGASAATRATATRPASTRTGPTGTRRNARRSREEVRRGVESKGGSRRRRGYDVDGLCVASSPRVRRGSAVRCVVAVATAVRVYDVDRLCVTVCGVIAAATTCSHMSCPWAKRSSRPHRWR